MLRYMNFKPWNYFTLSLDKSELQENIYLSIIECVFNLGLYVKEQSRGLFRNSSTKSGLDWRSIDLVLSPSLFFCDGTERWDLWGITGSLWGHKGEALVTELVTQWSEEETQDLSLHACSSKRPHENGTRKSLTYTMAVLTLDLRFRLRDEV